jgi:hypothetical protein
MVHDTRESLQKRLESAGVLSSDGALVAAKASTVREQLIDELVWTAVFSSDEETRETARTLIHALARQLGAVPASIQPLYEAIGRGEVSKKFTVPAHNIRTLTYDTSRRLFRAAMEQNAGPFIFEIARSEIGYTEQRPGEYAACVLAAAIKEGYEGPVFIQGDHFQASAKRWTGGELEKERGALEALIDEAIAAEFYNIDIDTSTLVDLSHAKVEEQQRANYEGTAHFTRYIRERQPKGLDISIGGEIGEVGKHNTNPEEFRAYMTGFYRGLGDGVKGISKVSIQTGTSHGGVVMADGTIETAKIDFDALRTISKIAREEFNCGGSVQHGASTLSEEVFDQFPKNDTLEIHLATGFQNMVLDHPRIPKDLREDIAAWVGENAANERKQGETEEQFIYKSRKKALGPFKRRLWDLPPDVKDPILDDLQAKFAFLMRKLAVDGTKEIVQRHVRVEAGSTRPEFTGAGKKLQMSALVVEGEGE